MLMRVDRTLSLLLDGYLFLPKLRRAARSEVVLMRLLGQRAMAISGPDATGLFYDPDRFERATAMPGHVKKTLTGVDGVQTLDGEAHARRKAMFMSLMTPERGTSLRRVSEEKWQAAIDRWGGRRVVLFDEARDVLFRAACGWVGLPPGEADTSVSPATMTDAVDAFAAAGVRYRRGRRARAVAERWAVSIVERTRGGMVSVSDESPARIVASHTDERGSLLDRHTAGVELLNLIRPITAVTWWVVFVAHALHRYPEWRSRAANADEALLEAFVQEVRRHYPFTPFVGARVKHDFSWRGHEFPKGTLVVLDVFGAHHDPVVWEEPLAFRPERFVGWEPDPFTFIPQGGGHPETGHRCAGDRITIELMKAATVVLAREITYDVPDQDLGIPLAKIPTAPRSGFRMTNVRRAYREYGAA